MKNSRLPLCLAFLLLPFLSSAAVVGDEHWDNQFGPVGLNDWGTSLAAFQGKVYAGGFFTAAGNTHGNLVAGFDGTNWFALNNGITAGPVSGNFYVNALLGTGNNLYVGGNFTNADNSGARYIARWDGTNWSAMGNGLSAYRFSLEMVATNSYAG